MSKTRERKFYTEPFILQEGEILRELKNYPWYISNMGRLKSKKLGTEKKSRLGNTGYYRASFGNSGYLVHRLVAEAFIGEIPKGCVVNHINGIKTDNRVENLEIITPSENVLHAIQSGLATPFYGEKHPLSKISEFEASEIIEDIISGHDNTFLSEKYGLSYKHISSIRHKRRWKNLWEKYSEYTPTMSNGHDKTKSLTYEQFVEVVDLINQGSTNAHIERTFSLSGGTASRIRHKKIYKGYWGKLESVINKI